MYALFLLTELFNSASKTFGKQRRCNNLVQEEIEKNLKMKRKTCFADFQSP